MSNKLILLNKDTTVNVVSQDKKFDKSDVDYILVPINGFHTHILAKPTKYMWFSRAEVIYRISTEVDDVEGEEHLEENYSEIRKDIDNYIELINLIHSILRIHYATEFGNNFYQDSVYLHMFLYVSYLEITLYDKDNHSFYNKIYIANTSECDIWTLCTKPLEIFKAIFNTRTDFLLSIDKCIVIKNDKWCIKTRNINSGLIGIILFETESIIFLPFEYFDILQYVENVKYSVTVYSGTVQNINKISELVKLNNNTSDIFDNCTESNFEIWEEYDDILNVSLGKPQSLVELISYLFQYYVTILLLYSSYLTKDCEFDVVIELGIMSIRNDIENNVTVTINKNNIPTVEDIVHQIYRNW